MRAFGGKEEENRLGSSHPQTHLGRISTFRTQTVETKSPKVRLGSEYTFDASATGIVLCPPDSGRSRGDWRMLSGRERS